MKAMSIILSKKEQKARTHKYYKCTRCGYVSIIKDSICPICIKDGYTLKLK